MVGKAKHRRESTCEAGIEFIGIFEIVGVHGIWMVEGVPVLNPIPSA